MPSALIVLTSNSKMVDSDHKTGWYLPELAHPYYVFHEAGISMTAATPKGGESPLDQASVDAFKEDPDSKKFLADPEAVKFYKNTQKLSEVDLSKFDFIFHPGGHGPIAENEDPDVQNTIRTVFESKRPVALVCHAPAVLTGVKLTDGSFIGKGRKVTGFTNAEEEQAGLTKNVQYLLEDVLKEQGAHFEAAAPWTERVVIDKDSEGRTLLTGQNPQSALALAKELVKLVK